MREDLMLEVASTEASEHGWGVGPLGFVSHDGTSWSYERCVGPSKVVRGYASHLAALGALLTDLAELGEPDALLAELRSEEGDTSPTAELLVAFGYGPGGKNLHDELEARKKSP